MTVRSSELEHLKEMLLKMAALVEAAIKKSVDSLVERESGLASQVIQEDQ